MSKQTVDLSGKREVFWDDYIIEPERTTATLRLHKPVKKERVLHLDMPWEGDGCDYYNLFKDGDIYRMYYLGWVMIKPAKSENGEDIIIHDGSDIKVCYAESRDGIHWERPNLGICEYNGSKDNNIILDQTTDIYDNFFAFLDENPNAKPEEKYKGVAECGRDGSLWGYTSPDGIHWSKDAMFFDKKHGTFDSLNICHWDKNSGKYYCYIRNFHDNEATGEYGIRDVRLTESDDFWHWTEPVPIDFGDRDDYPLYTNNCGPYYRADHIITGFPTRYVQYYGFDELKNFKRLCGYEQRVLRAGITERLGSTVTDAIFMTSRDRVNFHRFDEAWLTPGPENGSNWVYGDCYPAYGMIETPSEYEGADNEISMYNFEGKWTGKPSNLYRYTVRLDGFASYYGDYPGRILVTRPFTFEGSQLKINFSTSARGHIKIKVLDGMYNEIEGFYTTKIFGNSADRIIDFENGDMANLCGETVRLSIELSDADIYSFIIE